MRQLSWTLTALFAPLLAWGGVATAEDPKPAAEPPKVAAEPPKVAAEPPKVAAQPPKIASDEEVALALERFKEQFKAKGLKGEEKTSQRDFAMNQVAQVQHREVVEALARVTHDPEEILRTLAVIYLGEQTACPGAAGSKVAAAMKKDANDPVIVMSALQSLASLKYLGARDALKVLLKDEDFALKKTAILTVGSIGDMRLIEDLLRMVGVVVTTDNDGSPAPAEPEKKNGSGKETETEGYSWEGVDMFVASADGGDDQKTGQAVADKKIAENKAAAKAAAAARDTARNSSGKSGSGAGSEPAAGPRGAATRTTEELIPYIKVALKKLTGVEFKGTAEVKTWISEHREEILAKKKALDAEERRQAAEAAKK